MRSWGLGLTRGEVRVLRENAFHEKAGRSQVGWVLKKPLLRNSQK